MNKKSKEASYITYLDSNNLYEWAMFKWKQNTSKFNENSDIGYIIEVDVEYPKRLYNFHNDLTFLLERMQLKNATSLCSIFIMKKKKIILCT